MNHIKTAIEEYYIDDQDRLQGEYKMYRDNGELYIHCFFVDGKRHGELKSFYDNGELYIHCFYEDGKYHGEYKSYCDNGRLQIHCIFVDGKYRGEYKVYHYDGQLARHCFYIDDTDVMNEVKPLVRDISNITSEEKVILKLQLSLDI